MTLDLRGLGAGLVCAAAVLVAAGPAAASGEFDLATRLAMLGDYEGSLAEYEMFLRDHGRHELAPLAALAAGNLHAEVREDYEAAARRFDQVVAAYSSSPWAPEAARRRGEVAEALEDWRTAGEAFDEALELAAQQGNTRSADWINEVTAHAGDAFYHLGDHDRVLRTYRKVIDSDPPAAVAATALYRMAETYEATERPEEAARAYTQILETCPGGSREVAVGVMGKRDLIDRHVSFDWTPYDLYGEAAQLMEQRSYSEALQKCTAAEASCRNPRMLECLDFAKIYLETTLSGDYSTGYRRVEAYVEKYPRPQLAEEVGTTLDHWSQIVEAEVESKRNPEDAAALASLGTLYLRAGSLEAAVRTLETARDLDPERPGTRRMLGYAYNYAGRQADAAREFEVFLAANPDDTNALNMVGYAYMGQEQYEEAITYFRRYVELAPDEANAHDSLGEGLYRAGRLEEAAREYEKAVSLDPSFYNSYFFLGQIHREIGNKQKSAEAYERFLELIPDGPQADEARAALQDLAGQQL